MSRRKGLMLDANILLRAVFGQRVRELLEAYEDEVDFYSPTYASTMPENTSRTFLGVAGLILPSA